MAKPRGSTDQVHQVVHVRLRDQRWRVVVSLANVHGRLECVNVEVGVRLDSSRRRVEPADQQLRVLSATSLRGIPFGELIEKSRQRVAATADYVLRAEEYTDGRPIPVATRQTARREARRIIRAATAKAKARGGRPRYGADHLAAVADVYRDAFKRGSPTKAVQEWGGVSYGAAAKWVARARKAGLLGTTTPGRPGEGRKR